jgi:hypothetical protein
LENINCMIEKFPLAKANDAFSKVPQPSSIFNADFSIQTRC